MCSTCSRIGRTKFEHLDDDPVRHLGFLDDVGEDRERILVVGQLPFQQPGHHLDAGERILDFVGDRGRHLAERNQPVLEPLPLFELLDPGQILEEKRRAGDPAAGIAHLRQREADHLVGPAQPSSARFGRCDSSKAPAMMRMTSGRSFKTSA